MKSNKSDYNNLINLQMEKEVKPNNLQSKLSENPQNNPRKAATKLKQMQINLQIMRNRFKVLQGQDQYHRYRTIDHTKKISHHTSIHQKISKQKQQLKKSMQIRAQISDMKIQNEQLRSSIRQNIANSRQNMLTQRRQRSQLINQQLVKNQEKIRQIKEKDYQLNKAKKTLVLQQQQSKRQNLKKHYQNKIKSTLFQKQKDSSYLNKEVNNIHQQLTQMLEIEKKLVQKYSKSLQTSQLMKSKYNQVVNISQRSASQKLPQIKSSTGKHTSISQRL